MDNNERVWSSSLQIWKRQEEQPCVLVIEDFDPNVSAGRTIPKYLELLEKTRRLYQPLPRLSAALEIHFDSTARLRMMA